MRFLDRYYSRPPGEEQCDNKSELSSIRCPEVAIYIVERNERTFKICHRCIQFVIGEFTKDGQPIVVVRIGGYYRPKSDGSDGLPRKKRYI